MFALCTYLPQAIGFLTLSPSLMLQHGQENALVVWPCQDDGDVCKQCYADDCSISHLDLQRLYGGRAEADGGSRSVLLNTCSFPLLTEHQRKHGDCKSDLLKHGWRLGTMSQSTTPMIYLGIMISPRTYPVNNQPIMTTWVMMTTMTQKKFLACSRSISDLAFMRMFDIHPGILLTQLTNHRNATIQWYDKCTHLQ